ncbi:MAG: TolC family protein [Rhodospirillales bacterium]|nr:TolC family protein [Rhodospirillales bacterium]MCB9973145.1 TolC family protein [Rhodospirillales bacterium]MCB9980137.1 TolC family protein [Rhodospirillales bacterium]
MYVPIRHLLKISAVSFFLTAGGYSVPVQAESLQGAMAAALQYHPSVEAAQAAQLNLKDQRLEQKSAYYPELSVNATGGRVYGDNATSRGLSVTRGSGYSYLWEGSVGLSQRIFDGFETNERVDAARARYQSKALDIRDIRESLALQTAQAYFDVMRTKETQDVIVRHNAQIDDYRQRIVSMVSEGAADEAELKQAEDITILLDNILAEYQAQFLEAQSGYLQLTGKMPSGEMELPVWEQSLFPETLAEAEIQLAEHPSLLSAQYRIEAGSHDVAAEEAAFFPDVNGEVSYLKKDLDDIIGGDVIDARAVVKMNWNFSTGGGQFAKVRQRQASLFEAQAQKRQLERELQQSLRRAWIEYETADKILRNMDARRSINQNLFETNQTQFEGAQIRLLNLMQSENQYFQTRLEYINAIYRKKISELGVLAALGQLQTAFHLEVDNPDFPKKGLLANLWSE